MGHVVLALVAAAVAAGAIFYGWAGVVVVLLGLVASVASVAGLVASHGRPYGLVVDEPAGVPRAWVDGYTVTSGRGTRSTWVEYESQYWTEHYP